MSVDGMSKEKKELRYGEKYSRRMDTCHGIRKL